MHYFSLTSRLQRLYASKGTTKDIRCHKEHEQKDGMICHPSETKAWKHFDHLHPFFASQARNVRLRLCTDEFQPFGQLGKLFSYSQVIVTPYNLPP